jgi:hypothetical protein
MLAPLGSLFTPLVAHADSVLWTTEKKCTDKTNHTALVKIEITVRTSDNAARITAYQFRDDKDSRFGPVRQSQVWEKRVLNEKPTYYYPDPKTNEKPPANKRLPLIFKDWISAKAGVKRYGHVWLYSDQRSTGKNTCDVEFSF